MNKKLLTQISKYLPYNTKIKYKGYDFWGTGILCGINFNTNIVSLKSEDSNEEFILLSNDCIFDIKPILVPLEDIPTNLLDSLSQRGRKYFKSWLDAQELTKEQLKFDLDRVTGADLEVLLQSKYDIFRLIPNKQAYSVDIYNFMIYGFEESRLR